MGDPGYQQSDHSGILLARVKQLFRKLGAIPRVGMATQEDTVGTVLLMGSNKRIETRVGYKWGPTGRQCHQGHRLRQEFVGPSLKLQGLCKFCSSAQNKGELQSRALE